MPIKTVVSTVMGMVGDGGFYGRTDGGLRWVFTVTVRGDDGATFEESGRALLDTPPFAKCAKGRAPGLLLRWRRANTGVSPLRCASVEMTVFVAAGFLWGEGFYFY